MQTGTVNNNSQQHNFKNFNQDLLIVNYNINLRIIFMMNTLTSISYLSIYPMFYLFDV